MKILNVRFQNLNSLTGEWEIDFTDPAYISDGIFAITGPTGAGKTTVLDALCLALFGETPRLGKVTKSFNEIMSRHKGECFAQVTFETNQGRFRCHWSQHRSRKKPDGKLQAPKHELVDAANDKVLESRLTDVALAVEEKTGMDFDRFVRSMLLAQGDFAAFLRANADERSPILEQITGTGIYSEISMAVHKRRGDEQGRLKLLEAEASGMKLLGEKDIAKIEKKLKNEEKRESEFLDNKKNLIALLDWVKDVTRLEKNLENLEKRLEEHEKLEVDFQASRERLKRGEEALPLAGNWAGLEALRKQQELENGQLEAVSGKLPAVRENLEKLQNDEKIARQALEEARRVMEKESEIIKRVRALDIQILEKDHQVEEGEESLLLLEKKASGHKASANKLELDFIQQDQECAKVAAYLSKHKKDEGLVSGFTGLEQRIKSLAEMAERKRSLLAELDSIKRLKEKTQKAYRQVEARNKTILSRFKEAGELKGLLDKQVTDKLKGRDLAQLRSERRDLRERKTWLEKADALLPRVNQWAGKIDQGKVTIHKLNVRKSNLQRKIDDLELDKEKWHTEAAHLETQANLAARVRDLEAERERLQDGKACPLCGALDHPYARGNVPAADQAQTALKKARSKYDAVVEKISGFSAEKAGLEEEIKQLTRQREEYLETFKEDKKQLQVVLAGLRLEVAEEQRLKVVKDELAHIQPRLEELTPIIEKVDALSQEREAARDALETAREELAKADKELQNTYHENETAQGKFQELQSQGDELCKKYDIRQDELAKVLSPYGVSSLKPEKLDKILADLATRRDDFQENQHQKLELDKKVSQLKTAFEKEQLLAAEVGKDLVQKKADLKRLMENRERLVFDRKELFGDKNPDEEEEKQKQAAKAANDKIEASQEGIDRVKKELHKLEQSISNYRESLAKTGEELDKKLESFKAKLAEAGFKDEKDFLDAQLFASERDELKARSETLKTEKDELVGSHKEKSSELAEKLAEKMTWRPQAELEEEITVLETDLNGVQQSLGALHKQLEDNKSLEERMGDLQEEIDSCKKECDRWDALHALIGSSDGKKYRNFVQGLTFERVINHANLQLKKMTDRYLLIRAQDQPLELDVVDNYQAGEIRSTKNLSGGESFMVSLALALGLSQMVSRNVRIDSLFLDEGFGTLDNDALETALETLASLRQDGKLIGVISHVPALKERIGVQLQLTPLAGGRSEISGPGCRRI